MKMNNLSKGMNEELIAYLRDEWDYRKSNGADGFNDSHDLNIEVMVTSMDIRQAIYEGKSDKCIMESINTPSMFD